MARSLLHGRSGTTAGSVYTARAEWGRKRADAYQTALTKGFERLRDFPEIGLRAWPVEHHVLYYRVKPTAIEIARILHQRADPAHHPFR